MAEPTETPPEAKTFTQAEVDGLMANYRKGLQNDLAQAQAEVEKLRKGGGDTKGLQTKIKELQDSLLSKEELARQQIEQTTAKFQQDLATAQQEKQQTHTKYAQLLLSNEVARAAVDNNAFSADQLQVFVGAQSEVVPVTDDKGAPTGDFKVVTKYNDIQMTVSEAVAKMREDKRFANLFKVSGIPGVGMTLNNTQISASDGKIPTSTEEYMAKRADLKKKGLV